MIIHQCSSSTSILPKPNPTVTPWRSIRGYYYLHQILLATSQRFCSPCGWPVDRRISAGWSDGRASSQRTDGQGWFLHCDKLALSPSHRHLPQGNFQSTCLPMLHRVSLAGAYSGTSDGQRSGCTFPRLQNVYYSRAGHADSCRVSSPHTSRSTLCSALSGIIPRGRRLRTRELSRLPA
jgi:hypothetical protein